jgi:polyisoprenyl-teichoic acid--peptidoglycan teichoic acid transferase
LAIFTGLLIPILLAAGLAASSLRGGAVIDMGDPAFEVTRVDQAHFSDLPGEPVFVLLVGHDARPGDRTARGDALHLVGVNPAAGRATILNFPRDLWVPIPGRGTAKINAGYEFGGAALQARTVAQLVGVNIPYVVTTGFEGFQAMVDDLGGMEVDVPMAMADRNSGAFFSPGVTHMDGWQALAMARNRGLAGGDITRTTNQAHLILAALTKLRGESPTVAKTLHWLAVLLRNATLDGAGYADLYRLGRLALSIDPANVRSYTVPGTVGSAANQSVVFLGGGASALFADFRDDAVLQSH